MARSLWTGAISFGLINIPVSVVSSKEPGEIRFHLLDRRDHSRIGYKQINKTTGQEVTRDEIVKAFEYDKDQYVVITDKDFELANPKATQTIDIEDFVKLNDIDFTYFEKPYYLIPRRGGEKGYELLRRVMDSTGMAAVGRLVMHRKQHLVAVLPRSDMLMLEILRFAHEIVSKNDIKQTEKISGRPLSFASNISPRELDMAEKLVASMATKWHPEKYKDTYHDDILKMIERKIRTGKAVEGRQAVVPRPNSNVADLMPLLQKSLAQKNLGHKSLAQKNRGRHRAAGEHKRSYAH